MDEKNFFSKMKENHLFQGYSRELFNRGVYISEENEDVYDDFEPDYDVECGFNPFLGCYDFEC